MKIKGTISQAKLKSFDLMTEQRLKISELESQLRGATKIINRLHACLTQTESGMKDFNLACDTEEFLHKHDNP